MIYSGGEFYRDAWHNAKEYKAGMHTLIALSTVSAFILSLVMLLFPASIPLLALHLHFAPILMILGIVNAGLALRGWMKYRIGKKLPNMKEKFHQLQPQQAKVQKDSTFVLCDVNQVKKGSRIQVLRGQRMPVSGKIIAITAGDLAQIQPLFDNGELLATKKKDDIVKVGDLNLGDTLEIIATEQGDHLSLLDKLGYTDAKDLDMPLVNKISAWFVPAVLLFAAVTTGAWLALGPAPVLYYAVTTSLAVLLAACPCSLGLAAPLSTSIAMKKLAKANILVRESSALETLAKVDTVVFDKTGTLTQGKFSIKQWHLTSGIDQQELLQAMASLEQVSAHPLAKGIVVAAQGMELSQVTAFNMQSNGISGTVNGKQVHIGNADYIGVDNIPANLVKTTSSRLYISIDGQYQGAVDLEDKIRPEAKAVITALKAKGIKVHMLTGAAATEAQQVAEALGIETFIAGVKPEEKEAYIKSLEGIVAMVGDGLNDGPAMQAAAIGLAMNADTHVVMNAGACLADDLQAVPQVFAASKKCMGNIKQNLAWSFGYNVICLLLAAGILYGLTGFLLPPVVAAGLMALSSLSVMLNATRLFAQMDEVIEGKKSESWYQRLANVWRQASIFHKGLFVTAVVSAALFGIGTTCEMVSGASFTMALQCMFTMQGWHCLACVALVTGYVGLAAVLVVSVGSLALHACRRRSGFQRLDEVEMTTGVPRKNSGGVPRQTLVTPTPSHVSGIIGDNNPTQKNTRTNVPTCTLL